MIFEGGGQVSSAIGEDRGAVGAAPRGVGCGEWVSPSPLGVGSGESPFTENVWTFYLELALFGAF